MNKKSTFDALHVRESVAKFRELLSRLEAVDAGRKFTRDEMNER